MTENKLYEEISKPIKELEKIIKENNDTLLKLAELKKVMPEREYNKFSKPIFKQMLKRLKNR